MPNSYTVSVLALGAVALGGAFLGAQLTGQEPSQAESRRANGWSRVADPLFSGAVSYVVWETADGKTEGITRGEGSIPGVNSTNSKRKVMATVLPQWVAIRTEAGIVTQFIPRDRIIELHFEATNLQAP